MRTSAETALVLIFFPWELIRAFSYLIAGSGPIRQFHAEARADCLISQSSIRCSVWMSRIAALSATAVTLG